jgi:hypothetical protein
MQIPKRWRKRIVAAVPRRRHLRGGRLHRLLGERLFHSELWAFTRRGVAEGVAVGLFIGCTPTMGVQVILCGFAAFLLRVNVPVAVLASLISNPLTAPILYPLEYKLGVWLVGVPPAHELEGFSGALRGFMRYARPLWAGSIATAIVCSVLGWGLVNAVWVATSALARRRKPSPAPPQQQPLPPSS